MRILIVLPDQDRATGNWVTAERFRRGLETAGHRVAVFPVGPSAAPLREEAGRFRPDLALLLHAWRSGRPWLGAGTGCPFLVLLTGTDLNHGLADPGQGPTIRRVLGKAAFILLQNPLLAAGLRAGEPQLAARVRVLPPGVELGGAPCDLRRELALPPEKPLLFCPAGIRPVKNQRDLLECLLPLARAGREFILVLAGPILDGDYGREVLERVEALPWARYAGVIDPKAMPAALRQAEVVLNHSLSEGLPNALLEAAVLGRPILARDIPGNAAIVRHGSNGLLYRGGTDFARHADRLLAEPGLRGALSRPSEDYDPGTEARQLEALCRSALAGAGP